VFNNKGPGFVAGTNQATRAAFDQSLPLIDNTIPQSFNEARKQANTAKDKANEASYAVSVDDFNKSRAASLAASTASKAAVTAAKNASDAFAKVVAAVAEGNRLAGEALKKSEFAYSTAKKTAERREDRATRRELAAKEAQEEHDRARSAWRLRAQLGVGHSRGGGEQIRTLAETSQKAGTAATQARQAAKAAKGAAETARDLADKSRVSGSSLVDMGKATEADAKAGSEATEAFSVTGGKWATAASAHSESVVAMAWYTMTKDLFAYWDRTGYTAPGIMGMHHEDMKTGLARENSPALEHKHPLQPRHVARFAEYVMKYKPGDLWAPALK